MIKIEIKNRFTGKVIFEYEKENNTISETIKEYTRQEIEIYKRYFADLRGANLLYFKSDLWRILLMGKNEIEGLVDSLKNGKVDGTVYEGECACLKGTIANVAGCKIERIDWMKKDISEPAEQWFLMIKKGDTPETSNVVKQTLEWIEEFKMFLNK